MSDENWVDLDTLVEQDPARAAIVNHLETAEDVGAADMEAAIEQTGLQLLQQLYEQSMADEGDPRVVLARMGVLEEAAPEAAAEVEAAQNDAPASAPNESSPQE